MFINSITDFSWIDISVMSRRLKSSKSDEPLKIVYGSRSDMLYDKSVENLSIMGSRSYITTQNIVAVQLAC